MGLIFLVLAAAMIIPAMVDLCFEQNTSFSFLISAMFCCFLGGLLFFSNQSGENIILNLNEKVCTVLFSWISVPVLASLPLIVSAQEISLVDCFFEMTSALTTSGATTILDIKSFSEGVLLWRSLLQLIGGIGFIISCLCVFSNFLIPISFEHNNYSRNLSPLNLIKIISATYFIVATIGSFILIGSGVSPIESISYSLDAISSGGALISDVNYSAASPQILWTLSLLMFISGVSVTFIKNLNSNGFSAFLDQQFICYTSIVILGTAIFSIYIMSSSDATLWDSIQMALLTTTSSITTTGVSLRLSESFSPSIDAFLYVLNFCGGCSGSCTGGVKIFRWMITFLLLKSYLIRLVKVNAICVPTYAGRRLNEMDVTGLFSYFFCYIVFAVLASFALTFSDFDFGKAFNAVVTTINNNGPFFGLHKATVAEIAELSPFTKIILIISMIAGRIEFISFLMVLMKSFWKK
jgi:trk system potassium uptake protein TrkH